MKLEFSGHIFLKKIQIPSFNKICPLGVELFQADVWTDGHDEANTRFSQFCESTNKKEYSEIEYYEIVTLISAYGVRGSAVD